MFLVHPFPLCWLREYTIFLTIIIKSEVWTINHCLGLNCDKCVDVETHTQFHNRQHCKLGAVNLTFAAIANGNSSHRQLEGFHNLYNTPKLEPIKASSTCSLILHHRQKKKHRENAVWIYGCVTNVTEMVSYHSLNSLRPSDAYMRQ